MPLTSSFYRLSYLKQNQDNLDAAQLLEWLGIAKETIEINEQTINQLIVEQEELIIQLSELQKEVNQKVNKKETIKEEAGKIYKLIGELEQKEQQNQDLHRQNATLERELTKLKKSLTQENQQKEQIINDLQNTVQQQSETINGFQQRIQSLNQKQKQARQSKQRLEKELAKVFSGEVQKEIKIQKLKAGLIFHKDKLIDLTRVQEDLMKDNQETTTINQQLQNDLTVISQKLTSSQEKNSILEEKIVELEEKLQDSARGERVDTFQLEKELNQQKQDYQTLVDDYQLLHQNSEKLKERLKIEQVAKENDDWSWGKISLVGGIIGIVILGIVFWKKLKSLIY